MIMRWSPYGACAGGFTMAEKMKKLYRSGKERMLGGVCGGVAEYFSVDPTLVRLAWVLVSLMYGTGLLLYIIAWIIVPRNPAHSWKGK